MILSDILAPEGGCQTRFHSCVNSPIYRVGGVSYKPASRVCDARYRGAAETPTRVEFGVRVQPAGKHVLFSAGLLGVEARRGSPGALDNAFAQSDSVHPCHLLCCR